MKLKEHLLMRIQTPCILLLTFNVFWQWRHCERNTGMKFSLVSLGVFNVRLLINCVQVGMYLSDTLEGFSVWNQQKLARLWPFVELPVHTYITEIIRTVHFGHFWAGVWVRMGWVGCGWKVLPMNCAFPSQKVNDSENMQSHANCNVKSSKNRR